MVLIFNDSPHPNGQVRSIGAYRISTALQQAGIEVEVIDFISRWNLKDLLSYLDKITNISWVGFSSRFTMDITPNKGIMTALSANDELELLQYLKRRNISIVVGGATADKFRPYLVNQVDYCITGYADVGVLAMHHHIVSGQELTYSDYKGIKVVNCDVDYKDIDLTNIATYYQYSDFVQQYERFPLEIGRGCIFKCAFCNFAHIGKKKGTYIRDKESIKAEIIDRYNKYKSTHFYFLDDTFNDSLEKMQMIAEIRQETQIPFEFWAYCRLDVLMAQAEMQNLLPELGWKSLTFGIETFNYTSGKAVGKGANPDKLKNFLLDLTQRFPDLDFSINIIAGLPADTRETLYDTANWFLENPSVAGNVHVIPLEIYNPNDSEGRKVTSRISQTPEQFGYEVSPINNVGVPLMTMLWKTKTLDTAQSEQIAKELEPTLNKNRRRKWVSYKTVGTKKIRAAADVLVNGYIESKLKYRGLLP
jgi:hypothetical protein